MAKEKPRELTPAQEKRRAKNQRFLAKNPDYMRNYRIERRQKVREYVSKIRDAAVCEHCGSRKDICFHHVNPADKKYKIDEMIGSGMSLRTIDIELSKCITLCRSCHSILHQELKKEVAVG